MPNEKTAVAVPGERLGSLEEYLPGKGTYIRHGYLYSSLVGFKHVETNENKKPIIHVSKEQEKHVVPEIKSMVTCKAVARYCSGNWVHTLYIENHYWAIDTMTTFKVSCWSFTVEYNYHSNDKTNSIFLVSISKYGVTSVNPRFCKVAILGVEATPLKETFRGMIRKEDVRATEKDRVEIYKSFRPGDIVLARVISLGDAQSYLLSTAENELGVVFARSEAGAMMVPISWCEMQCPKTTAKEFRKVAKVQQPNNIENS